MNNCIVIVLSLLSILFLISLNSYFLLNISIIIGISTIGLLIYNKKNIEMGIYLLLIYIFSIFIYKKNNKKFKFNNLKKIKELKKKKK